VVSTLLFRLEEMQMSYFDFYVKLHVYT